MNSPQSRNARAHLYSRFQFVLTAAALAIPAFIGIVISANKADAQGQGRGQGQGPASVTIVGPFPVPITGTVKIDSSGNTINLAGTVPVTFTAPTLFRGKLVNNGPNIETNVRITNSTPQMLVVEFVDSIGASHDGTLILLLTESLGEQHAYGFSGPIGPISGQSLIAQSTKIILRPGETLQQAAPLGTTEVTGHYE